MNEKDGARELIVIIFEIDDDSNVTSIRGLAD